MQEIKCEICGMTVSKRQSYSYNGGRACKTHQEAQQANQQHESNVEANKLRERMAIAEKAYRRTPEYHHNKVNELKEWSEGHCWCCGTAGFTSQVYAMGMLVAMERMRLKGEDTAPFLAFSDPKRLLQESGLDGMMPLVDYVFDRRDRMSRHDMYDIAQLLGVVRMCKKCAIKGGRHDFDDRFAPERKLTYEQIKNRMVAGMIMAESIKPDVEAMAKASLGM